MTTTIGHPGRPGTPPPGRKSQDAIWTRVVIDPPADLLVRPLARLSWVTPNRVSAAAGALAVASAAAFLSGRLVLGALLFQLRFLVDCLDGRLARIRDCATTWGAALDPLVDVVGVTLNFAALAVYLVGAGATDQKLVAAIVAGSGVYMWTLAHRKSLPGGGPHDWLAAGARADRSLRGRYVRAMARRGMVPTPYAVEVEVCALTLAPLSVLVVPDRALEVIVASLWAATAFYVVASLLNVYRTWRLATAIDARRDRPSR